MSPELAGAIAAVLVALARELLAAVDRRQRRRGTKRTRDVDGP